MQGESTEQLSEDLALQIRRTDRVRRLERFLREGALSNQQEFIASKRQARTIHRLVSW